MEHWWMFGLDNLVSCIDLAGGKSKKYLQEAMKDCTYHVMYPKGTQERWQGLLKGTYIHIDISSLEPPLLFLKGQFTPH